MIRTQACAIALIFLAGCDWFSAGRVERASRAPLGTLEGRDYTIEIYAGPIFTVLSADGKVLAELMTTEELQAQHPELHRKLEYIYAANIADVVKVARPLSNTIDVELAPTYRAVGE